MIKHIWSLVLFTLLVQLACGAFVFITAAWNITGSNILTGKAAITGYICILIMLVISLVISFTHLGRPSKSFYALSNIKKSWLSREILTLTLFTLLILLSLFLIRIINPGTLFSISLYISGLFLVVYLMYSMVRIYWLKTIRSWRSLYTVFNFIVTSLLSGAVFYTVISFTDVWSLKTYQLYLILFLLLVQMIVLLSNRIYPGAKKYYTAFLYFFSAVILTGILFGFIRSFESGILFLFLLSVTLIYERYLFYITYKSSGL